MKTSKAPYLPALLCVFVCVVANTTGCMTAKPYTPVNPRVIEYEPASSPQELRRAELCSELAEEYTGALRWCEAENVSNPAREASCRMVASYRNDCLSDEALPVNSGQELAGEAHEFVHFRAPATQ